MKRERLAHPYNQYRTTRQKICVHMNVNYNIIIGLVFNIVLILNWGSLKTPGYYIAALTT